MTHEHPITEQIIAILKKNNCWYEVFNHEAVRTSEEAAKLRPNYSMEQGAKAIIAKIKIPHEGKKFIMLVLPGHKRFDQGKVNKLTNAKEIRFAMEKEVEEITKGVKPGGVPPFGNLFGLEVLCDESLFDNEKIVFNAGRTSTIAMKSKDYLNLVKPKVAVIS